MTELNGRHECSLYRTDEQHYEVLRAFVEDGLGRQEKVIYITDQHTAKSAMAQLERNGVHLQPHVSTGQVQISTVFQSFLRKGVFDPNAATSWLKREIGRARDHGFQTTRFAAEMTWVLRGIPGSERLIDYEMELNQLVGSMSGGILCQYDTRRFSPAVLQYVFMSHPTVVLGTVVVSNRYYCVSPASFGGYPASTILNTWMAELGGGRQVNFPPA